MARNAERAHRLTAFTWAAVAEVTLAATIYTWSQNKPAATSAVYGLSASISLLCGAMAATAVGVLAIRKRSRWGRRSRLTIGVCVAGTAAGPGSLALLDFLTSESTGIYWVLMEATVGICVVATVLIRPRRKYVSRQAH